MKSDLFMEFTVDKANSKVSVKREFAAPLQDVWAAWTESELLDQWWAPKPWKAKTKIMDFRPGGFWLYAMVGPEGEEHWGRADYLSIEILKYFKAHDAFCDEEGNVNNDFPQSDWKAEFSEEPGSTFVRIEMTSVRPADLQTYIEMGFQEGFTMALENLDEMLRLRQRG
jgi:uncharacterized protein YndB with AHSA1/START domain